MGLTFKTRCFTFRIRDLGGNELRMEGDPKEQSINPYIVKEEDRLIIRVFRGKVEGAL